MSIRPRASRAPATPSKEQVAAFYAALPMGRINALNARTLSARLNLGRNGDRRLRALAHAATDANMLVCGDSAGYYRPATAEEARESVGRLMSQARHMAERGHRLIALIDQTFGQQGTLL